MQTGDFAFRLRRAVLGLLIQNFEQRRFLSHRFLALIGALPHLLKLHRFFTMVTTEFAFRLKQEGQDSQTQNSVRLPYRYHKFPVLLGLLKQHNQALGI